ncbi:MAG: hypothetical protein PHI50_05750 [Alphaproteobacteria bacterium]|nr:hypothetical protein [Alphaproteobacteria bacterium]
MNKLTVNLVLSFVAFISSIGMYVLKGEVKSLETEHLLLQRKIFQTKEEIHVLEAEKSYLSSPERLKFLGEKVGALQETSVKQLYSFSLKKDEPFSPFTLASFKTLKKEDE